jgi:hypothetical protein
MIEYLIYYTFSTKVYILDGSGLILNGLNSKGVELGRE